MNMRSGGIGIVLIVCAAAIGCVTYQYPTNSSQPQAPVPEVAPAGGSDQPFYDDLAPYGRWVYVSGPGWVWSPYNVQADWRPYRLGHWVFTDYGWTWASDEQWGWAVYHYGRWHQDPSYGWVWVPGTEWGPAWVAWHEGGGYVGWAPLPWQVRVQAGVGIDWAGINVSIEPSWWCFVGARNLVDPGLRSYIVPTSRNVNLIQVTKNVTNYTYIDNRVYNQGVKVESIGRAVGHTIPRYRVTEDDLSGVARGGKVKGQDFVVFRHDPPRGRKSQGRTDPPGHDQRDRVRDLQQAADDARQQIAPPPAAPPQNPEQANAPANEPPSNGGRDDRDKDRGRKQHEGRGRKLLEALTGQQPPPRRSPQGNSPPPPAPPGQPPTTTSQPSDATAPPAEARPGNPPPGNPPSGEKQGTSTHPGRPDPSKGQIPGEKPKGARDAGPRGKKPKADAAKPDDSKPDEPKKDKPDSGN